MKRYLCLLLLGGCVVSPFRYQVGEVVEAREGVGPITECCFVPFDFPRPGNDPGYFVRTQWGEPFVMQSDIEWHRHYLESLPGRGEHN